MATCSYSHLGLRSCFILLLLLSPTFIGVKPIKFLLGLLGKAFDLPPEQSYQPIGNQGCEKIYTDILDGCEDCLIIEDEAFLACGDSVLKSLYFPPALLFDEKGKRKVFDDQVFKMNLRTKELTRLEKIGYNGDTVHHGLGEYIFPDDNPQRVNLFFVNHIRGGSCITIYEHILDTNTLRFLKNVCHSMILTPNDVAPVGPLQFYITNDHRYRSGWRRQLENKLHPTLWHQVVYCDASTDTVHCKVAANGGMATPNGIVSIDEGQQIIVSDSASGNIYRYNVDSKSKLLRLRETIVWFAGIFHELYLHV